MLMELEGLQGIDIAELREELPEDSVTVSPRKPPSDAEYGDFGATVVVILSAAAIHALAVWMAKRRVQTETLVEASAETTPEGAKRVTVRLEMQHSMSEPPSPEVVSALKAHLNNLVAPAAGNSPG